MSDSDMETSGDMELVPDEDGASPDVQKKIKRIREDLMRCDKERKEYLDGWQRAKADLINYKKDEAKRLEDLARFASAELLEDILPALDGFDLALGSSGADADGDGAGAAAPAPSNEHAAQLERGIRIIRSQLMDILKKHGISEISANPGDSFDPSRHESIGEVESDQPAGTIAEVSQKGYVLAGRVIRPARVKLSKEK